MSERLNGYLLLLELAKDRPVLLMSHESQGEFYMVGCANTVTLNSDIEYRTQATAACDALARCLHNSNKMHE